MKIGVNEIGWYPSNLQARQTAITTADPFFAGTQSGGQIVDQIFANENIVQGWDFPPDLDAVTNFEGNDFNTALTNHLSLVSQLPDIQSQVIQDLQSQGINATAGS